MYMASTMCLTIYHIVQNFVALNVHEKLQTRIFMFKLHIILAGTNYTTFTIISQEFFSRCIDFGLSSIHSAIAIT